LSHRSNTAAVAASSSVIVAATVMTGLGPLRAER
jgi:hypothetical protein